MTTPEPTTDRPPMPPAEFLVAVTMVGERAAAGYGWQVGYLAGRAQAFRDAAQMIENSKPESTNRNFLRALEAYRTALAAGLRISAKLTESAAEATQ